MDIKYLKIDDLIPYINNARTHSKDQIQMIASSIKEFGFNDPIAIDAKNGIIAGHGRLEAAKLLGLEEVPTIRLDHLTKSQQKAYVLAHNRIALDSGWDSDLLKIEFNELIEAGFDLDLTGFDQKEIDAFLNAEIENEFEDHESDGLGETAESICKLGDIWILGDHRLMCGDSTNPQHVDSLIDNDNPNLMVTDPPYGVNYDLSWRAEARESEQTKMIGKVENDHLFDWTDTYSLFKGNVVYIWHAGIYSPDVGQHLRNCGFELINLIIWNKQNFALSRGDYHWKHEPCWYAVRKGEKHAWNGKRDQSTVWDISNHSSKAVIDNPDEAPTGHGTQKPLECMARPILNNSKMGDYVYDPFGGSGSTLIACEKNKRKCLMMELSPQYCDAIIKRWERITGGKACLKEINNG